MNVAGVVTVGASDRNDEQANYSPTSSLIDVVAPSHRAYPCQITGEAFEMWTIDIPGDAGYNSWHESGNCLNPPQIGEQLPNNGTNFQSYTGRFGGTSHSCPVVAGVAALLLSVDPSLNYMDVFNILTNTAEDVGGYTYTNGRCNEMGHGRVNAHCAVQNAMAELSSITGPSPICMAGTYTINLPSEVTIEWTQSNNLTRISAQGANPCTFSVSGLGAGWVGATIICDCGNINLPQKNIWIGPPDYTMINVNLQSNRLVACDYTSGTANYNGTAMVDAFDWYLPNATNWSIRDEQSFPIIAYKYVEIHYWEDPAPFQEDIYIRAHNSCGWSNWKRTTWPVVNHCGGWLLVLTPNPSAGETTVSIESASAESPHINTGWDLEVYDQSQQLKVKKTRLKGPAYALNTMGWKDGIYIIRVNYNGELLTGKLAVKEQ